MRKTIFHLIFAVLLVSLVSSGTEIIINQQPKEVYSIGDTISVPVTIKSLTDMSGIFQMDIICNGQVKNFYKNSVGLSTGEEKRMDPILVLTKTVIGELKGDCKIKAMLNQEYIMSNEFSIVDTLTLQKTSSEAEFEPGAGLYITGKAIRGNGQEANGFLEMQIMADNSTLMSQTETIRNGFFMINATIPADMKSGNYLVRINGYEKDLDGLTTNKGSLDFNVVIRQVPRNLEIIIENPEVEPGTSMKAKTVLHDQTGISIAASSSIIIRNKAGEIMAQLEKPTDETFEFPIVYNEAPSNWSMSTTSRELTAEAFFIIKEKEAVGVEIINKTLVVTNKGNVPYNKSVLVKISNETLSINVSLVVDEVKKFLLTAPNGEYEIEVLTNEGDRITGLAVLTGKTVGIKEPSEGIVGFIKRPFVWIFIISVFGLFAFLVFRKVHKKSTFGFISKISKKKAKELISQAGPKDHHLLNTKNRAELALSIKGDKQDASVVCLKVKNYQDIRTKKDNVNEILRKISDIAEEHKSFVYENDDNVFFVLAPVKTKTFRNEIGALKIAQSVKEALNSHNKLFKSRINFGISVHFGTIVAKQEDTLKFMGLGTLITTAKKMASLSNEDEIFLSPKVNEKIQSHARTQKKTIGETEVYIIREMKNPDAHKTFISNFIRRIEGKEF
jgi:hypothetical protein